MGAFVSAQMQSSFFPSFFPDGTLIKRVKDEAARLEPLLCLQRARRGFELACEHRFWEQKLSARNVCVISYIDG